MNAPKVLCIGGTTEGRLFCESNIPTIYSALTELGDELVPKRDGLYVRHGVLSREDMENLIHQENVVCLVDATHPYAKNISKSAKIVASKTDIPYARLERESSKDITSIADVHVVNDAYEAAELALRMDGNVFLSTGANEILPYIKAGLKERLWVRILPIEKSIDKANEDGVLHDHIIPKMGPFTLEQNLEDFALARARILITKDGGKTGGFPEKIEAAQKRDMEIIVLKRPIKESEYIFHTVEEAQKWAQNIVER